MCIIYISHNFSPSIPQARSVPEACLAIHLYIYINKYIYISRYISAPSLRRFPR